MAANIVLVHGAWADGSCWSGVIERLQADGHHVAAPQLPETSVEADVARVRQIHERVEHYASPALRATWRALPAPPQSLADESFALSSVPTFVGLADASH